MLHLCTYGCLLPRPLREDRGHLKCRIRLSKATRVNLTATRYHYPHGTHPFLAQFSRPSVYPQQPRIPRAAGSVVPADSAGYTLPELRTMGAGWVNGAHDLSLDPVWHAQPSWVH